MASPVDAARSATNITTAGTSHNINVNSPSSGDMVVVAVRFAGAPGTVTFTGYNLEFSDNSDASDDEMHIYRRIADGTEGAQDTLGTTNSVKLATIAWRITGAATSGSMISTTSVITYTTVANTANPASLNTGTSKDYLWIAVAGQDGEVGAFTASPTNYSTITAANSGTGGTPASNVQMGGASRQLTAQTEDPGTFTHAAAATGGMAWTLAVHPFVAPAAAPPPHAVMARASV